jgi:hypothetical protein
MATKFNFHTPEGIINREATTKELEALAENGNIEAKTEILKGDLKAADTNEKKITAILKYLGAE